MKANCVHCNGESHIKIGNGLGLEYNVCGRCPGSLGIGKMKAKRKPETSYGTIEYLKLSLFFIMPCLLTLYALGVFMWIVPPKYQAQDVLFTVEIEIVEGSDNLYYSRCLQGCDEFYNVANIDELYIGLPTDWQAMNHYKRLESAYLGLVFVPIPPPESP